MMIVPLQAGLGPGIVVLFVLVVAVITVYSAIEIVNAYEKRALTVFGDYRKLLQPGINFVPPFVNNTYPFDMRTQTIDVPHQEAITRDNSPVTADAVVYIKVMDAKKAFLEVLDHEAASVIEAHEEICPVAKGAHHSAGRTHPQHHGHSTREYQATR
jgi:regulator of protease activity HflC (stomatin/prohibitin superfamily)